MIDFSTKKTITSIFIVPTLKIGKDSLKDNNFINGYIEDHSRSVQYKDCVHLLFKPIDIDKFRDFLIKEYERTESLIDDYDCDREHVILVYKLDVKHKKDFDLIKLGHYSKTSDQFQLLFPKIIKIMKGNLHRDEISLQYRIFNKTEDLVKFWEDKLDVNFKNEYEVWEGFDINNEILNINKIEQL